MLGELVGEIVGGVLRIVGSLLFDILFEVVCYYVGYPVVKLLTLGKYPKNYDSLFQEGETRQSAIVSVVGLGVLVAGGICLFLFIRKSGA